jgi:hypothetical protein
MNISYKRVILLGLIAILLMTAVIHAEPAHKSGGAVSSENQTWIIKWKKEADPAFASMSIIEAELSQFNAVVAKAAKPRDTETWVQMWKKSGYVEYIQLNHKVEISAKPNDAQYTSQKYLQQIKAEAAWDVVKENNVVTIAVVDTGIDLTHSDLKGNLVAGKNLINPGKAPQDDHGHGTNVAGVIAATGNNKVGTTGVLWKAKLMPIKALEGNGSGDESKLGEGIRYAVDNGARIVVLSLGLYKYSPYLRDVVQYAEDRGVLLVAASGNEGEAVKYPAAYPSVLAVGGVNASNQVMKESNFGSEIDVVAPWQVYTTKLEGEYGTNGGTSMAAPQAAGVAALIWAKYPEMKPYQIRNMIRQTAEDIGSKGWDNRSGYGLLRADLALTQEYRDDMYENNNSIEQAKPMPIGSMLSASLNGGTDQDWYTLDAPYEGQIRIEMKSDTPASLARAELVHYSASNDGTIYKDLTKTITLPVLKGQSFILIRNTDRTTTSKLSYRTKTSFEIYDDAFEDNDRQYKAYALPTKVQEVTGTFHQQNDEDWYMIEVVESGSLQMRLSMDTYRMDLELYIQKIGEKADTIDYGFEGITEYSPILDVLPGKYYIRVRNVISDQTYPVSGEYNLKIDYVKKFIDPNEPNEKAFQSTVMGLGREYKGVLSTDADVDWFSFRITEENYVTIDLSNIPVNRMMSINLLDNKQRELSKDINVLGVKKLSVNSLLPKGTYFIRVTANKNFQNQMYGLKVTADKLISGYRDIEGHWAQPAITKLTDKGIVNGYADYLFNPDQQITRAEAVVMIVNALNLKEGMAPNFTDVTPKHWAYNQISIAVKAGIITGYPDRTFQPNRFTNRVEMAVMLFNALNLETTSTGPLPFDDINESYWALNILKQMKAEQWIKGYQDGTFRPTNTASRAEFVALISRVVQ